MSQLDELTAAWPPAEDPADNGYVRPSLANATPLAATSLRSHGELGLAVVLARESTGRLLLAPLVREGRGWRRARPRDGASAALVEAFASDLSLDDDFSLRRLAHVGHLRGERAIGVDQTNESVVVGGAIVVKWLAEPDLRAGSAPDLQAHLVAVGYRGMPRPLGSLLWSDGRGQRATLAFLTQWLPDARDGWDWCVQDLLEHLDHGPAHCAPDCGARTFPGELGRLTAGLHVALATPSAINVMPSTTVGPDVVGAWAAAALDALETALALVPPDAATELRDGAGMLRAHIGAMSSIDSTLAQPIHGDLHVGQILRSSRGLTVIDLDDDISIDPADRGRPLPVARDVAQMACSLDLVGRLAERRTGGDGGVEIDLWIGRAQRDFLAAYRAALAEAGRAELLDERLLEPLTAERICRELIYASRVLPRWLDASMGTLRRVLRK